jgi:hypothetical protein
MGLRTCVVLLENKGKVKSAIKSKLTWDWVRRHPRRGIYLIFMTFLIELFYKGQKNN